MRILMVGSGGREHALIRKLKESPRCEEIYCAPGNGGISKDAVCVDISAEDIDGIAAFAKEKNIDLVFVAPDDPLAAGMVDALEQAGIRAFGPRKNAAVIESSKVFSKNLMKKYGIPTAGYEVFSEPKKAIDYITAQNKFPVVVKADGLALGKGVMICQDLEEAKEAVHSIMEDKIFGASGNQVVVEEFITGPEVVKSVTQEEVSMQDLGGSEVHSTRSGVAHFTGDNDMDCILKIRELMSFLPSNNMEEPPFIPTTDSANRIDEQLNNLIPTNPNQPYDMKELIESVADDHNFFEVQEEYAKNIVIGYIRLNGKTIGVVANQPAALAGTLDINASVKAARFVRFCDAFNIPLLTFVDVPGFLPGVNQEYEGIIRHGAKLLYAYCEATVPKVTVITRKAYGGAYDVMSSKHIRGDINFAYPTAEIAVMGPDGAVNILFRKELKKAEDVEKKRKELQDDYREKFANPYRAAELGYVDEIIEPSGTRARLIRSFELLANKRQSNPPKKHSNLPL